MPLKERRNVSKRQFKFMNAGDDDRTGALDIMECIFDSEGWTRAIQRDDGAIFLVDLGYAQRGAVQVVL